MTCNNWFFLAVWGTVTVLHGQPPPPPGQAQIITFAPVAIITATQGDGTSCTLSKGNAPVILANFSCVSSDGLTLLSPAVVIGGVTSRSLSAGLGDVMCLLGINGTGAPLAMGSLGTIPAAGLAWACSTNIRAAGNISGQTPIASGSVTWP